MQQYVHAIMCYKRISIENKRDFTSTFKHKSSALTSRFGTAKLSFKWISKIGDVEQDLDLDNPDSIDDSSQNKYAKKKSSLLDKLKDYDYLVSTNIFIAEDDNFPKLQLDF